MLTSEQINDLHRLYWSDRWPIRKIERHLRMGWRTIRKYLKAPAQGPALRSRSSKLDSFKGNISAWLEKDPLVTAAVIEQRYGGAADSLDLDFPPDTPPGLQHELIADIQRIPHRFAGFATN